MSTPPKKAALEKGMTVVIEQTDSGDELVGEIGVVLEDESTHPDGVLVQLKSGATGRVKRIGE